MNLKRLMARLKQIKLNVVLIEKQLKYSPLGEVSNKRFSFKNDKVINTIINLK